VVGSQAVQVDWLLPGVRGRVSTARQGSSPQLCHRRRAGASLQHFLVTSYRAPVQLDHSVGGLRHAILMRIIGRYLSAIVIVPVLAAAACSTATSNVTYSATTAVYRDHAGWRIAFPRTWHVVRFVAVHGSARAVGIQLSNVRLPRPQLVLRAPIQVSGEVLPRRGIGLVIATDSDRRLDRYRVSKPPLRYPDGWLTGSALGGAPYMRELWFRVHDVVLLATVKVGPGARQHDLTTLAKIVRSIRVVSATSG
jgi:hypothetical protein